MRHLREIIVFAAVMLALAGCGEPPAPPPPPAAGPYPEGADARAAIAVGLQRARESGKRVLLKFGANWCPDCLALEQSFTGDGPTGELIRANFEVVKIDVGRWDVNMDVAADYDEAASNGIPSIAVLDSEGKLLHVTKARELASARGMSEDNIHEWFGDLLKQLDG
ncbi:MAG: thioredoxin family protein [Gammaproteobacteria bacterium AqS3]|nr:thioredoxin family protein [Gammaproteobacteria bacterium AqS3]